MESQQYRNQVASNLDKIKIKMNQVLSGHNLQEIEPMKQEDKRADHYWPTPISLPKFITPS